VAYLAPLISHPDAKLKRQVCCTLAHIAKHSVDLAEVVVEAEIFPNILNCLRDADTMVRKNAAMCIREVSKHTPELAKLIVNSGGAAALVDYISESQGNNKLPGIMAIGYIAAFSETLALAAIVSKAVLPLKEALVQEPEDHIKAACAWTLGQIGRHTPDHARALAEGEGCYECRVCVSVCVSAVCVSVCVSAVCVCVCVSAVCVCVCMCECRVCACVIAVCVCVCVCVSSHAYA
jgi:hypothetical protein